MIFIQYASATFALAAAVLWFISAVKKTPQYFAIDIKKIDASFSGESAGTSYNSGHGHSKELDDLANTLCWQTKFNRWAALNACFSALLQGVWLFYT